MKVYVKSMRDWIDFLNGLQVKMFKNPLNSYYTNILVSPSEIISESNKTVIVTKKY